MKKMLMVVLSAIFAVFLMSTTAFAAENTAQITHNGVTTQYESVNAAVNAAADGDVIVMIADDNGGLYLRERQGDPKKLTLDLNGYILSYNYPVIYADKGWDFVLKDSGTRNHYFSYNPNGIWRNAGDDYSGDYIPLGEFERATTEANTVVQISGGIITGNSNGIKIYENTTVTMTGGSIVGCRDTQGAGVSNMGVFKLAGGNIIGCDASTCGGGVCNDPGDPDNNSFEMTSGRIISCVSGGHGGGVANCGGSFEMSGGLIADCVALSTTREGGGVYSSGAFLFAGGVITGCESAGDGGGVAVFDTFNMKGEAIITDCTAVKGGGIYIERYDNANGGDNFDCILTGGSIMGCSASDSGGAIYNYYGNLYLKADVEDETSPSIWECTAASYGGGIYCSGSYYHDNNPTVLEEGLIDGCTAKSGGGVAIFHGADFTMKGGSIANCEATENGGGVFQTQTHDYGGDFVMEDGIIEKCSANNGGGIFNDSGYTTLMGGSISKCTATVYGGGAHANGGAVTMHNDPDLSAPGISIEGCSAYAGGGVYVGFPYYFTIARGSITDCTAEYAGGGVYNNGSFSVKGNATVIGNTAGDQGAPNNVYLAGNTTLSLTGNLTGTVGIYQDGAAEGVCFGTVSAYDLLGTDNFVDDQYNLMSGVNPNQESELIWKTASAQIVRDGETLLFPSVRDAVAEAQPGETVTMLADDTITAADAYVLVDMYKGTKEKPLTIDLAGHTLCGNGSNQVIFISDLAYCILTDSSEGHTGKLTQPAASTATNFSYGVSVVRGTFVLDGATITGCKTTTVGGGVYCYSASVYIKSGMITNCNAWQGGGIYNEQGAVFLQGGTITGNTATDAGGGIYNKNYLYVSGNPTVTGNTVNGSENNVYDPVPPNGIQIVGKFTGKVGVSLPSSYGLYDAFGKMAEGETFSGVWNFTCDYADYIGDWDFNNNLVWVEPYSRIGRIAGTYANETSAAISSVAFEEDSCKYAIVACDDGFADAMSASGLAGTLNCPILLSNYAQLSASTKAEIERIGANKIYLIGGIYAMTPAVEAALVEIVGEGNVERIWGTYSWDTSVECAKKIAEHGGNPNGYAIVAQSGNFQDALSMSPFAYKYGIPIFLEMDRARNWMLPDEAVEIINGLGDKTIYVAGGNFAVDPNSVEDVFIGREIKRLAGTTGYDTSNRIANYLVDEAHLMSAKTVCIAYGGLDCNGVDALSGGALAGKGDGVMLLIDTWVEPPLTHTIEFETDSFLINHQESVEDAYVLGGQYVIQPWYFVRLRDDVLFATQWDPLG